MAALVAHALRRSVPAAVMCLSITPSLEAQGSAAIRVLDPALARALHDALANSTTLQGIVDEIERSDLIVHVVGLPPHERRHAGRNASTEITGAPRRVVGSDARAILIDKLTPRSRLLQAFAADSNLRICGQF